MVWRRGSLAVDSQGREHMNGKRGNHGRDAAMSKRRDNSTYLNQRDERGPKGMETEMRADKMFGRGREKLRRGLGVSVEVEAGEGGPRSKATRCEDTHTPTMRRIREVRDWGARWRREKEIFRFAFHFRAENQIFARSGRSMGEQEPATTQPRGPQRNGN